MFGKEKENGKVDESLVGVGIKVSEKEYRVLIRYLMENENLACKN